MRTTHVFPLSVLSLVSFLLMEPLSAAVVDTVRFSTTLGNAVIPENNQFYLGEEDPNASACSVHLLQDYSLKDACGDSVLYSVDIFLASGGPAIHVIKARSVALHEGAVTLHLDTRDNDLPSTYPNAVSGFPYTQSSCFGETELHRIVWRIQDACDTFEVLFVADVVDSFSPVIQCVSPFTILLPSSGSVVVWAKDFIGIAKDDCARDEEFAASFSGDSLQPFIRINCDDIACNGPVFEKEIWVGDHGQDTNCDGLVTWNERNRSSCTATFRIEDQHYICELGSWYLAGHLMKEDHEPVPADDVFLTQEGIVVQRTSAYASGEYFFMNPCDDLKQPATIFCERNDNHKNGVSTLDLIKVQKHLLNLETLDSPYKLIAADVNNSQRISVLDLVEIRKLILGLIKEFPSNTSWRFVPKDYVFPNPQSPWPVPEELHVTTYYLGLDFIGIKIGDVNGNADPLNSEVVTRRSGVEKKFFVTENKHLKAGEEYAMEIRSGGADVWSGFQLTLETDGISCAAVYPGVFDINEEWVGRHESALTMCYAAVRDINVQRGEVLFTLVMRAEQDVLLSDALVLSSGITEAEAYTQGSMGTTAFALKLLFGDSVAQDSGLRFELFQNAPNPFRTETTIGFYLPETAMCTLSIFSLHGQLIEERSAEYPEGFHEIGIHRTDFGGPGVYYYQVVAGQERGLRKCVVLE